MISADAFLIIEASLSQIVRKEAGLITKEFFSKVNEASLSGDFHEARDLLSRFSLSSMFAEDDEPLRYLTNVAMLFGASMVTQQPGTSVVGMGFESQTSKQMVLSFLQMIRQKAEVHLREKALTLLQRFQDSSIVAAEVSPISPPVLKAEGRVLRSFESFMDDAGGAYFNVVSSLHTSRASAFGFTAEAAALGYEEYQINEQLDSRTCPVCRLMHGKTFRVSDARALLNVVTRVTDPDDLKALQPWPSHSAENLAKIKDMTPAELVAQGWHIPPFHPRCRGLLGKVGKVPSLAALDSGTVKPEYESGPSDFKALGLKPTKSMVSQWNKNLPMAPAELVARLQGKTAEQLLSATLESKTPLKASGIKKFVLGDNLSLHLEAPGFGSSASIKQKLVIDFTSKTLFLNDVALPPGASGDLFKAYMVEAYSVAKDAGLAAVAVEAAGPAGGYAYAKYGFKPSQEEWNALRASVQEMADQYSLMVILPADQAKMLKAVLSSTDPGAIFSLADCSFGEFLLKGKSWNGTLNLKDAESVTRFLTYLGNLK